MLRQGERLRNASYGQEQEQEAGAGGKPGAGGRVESLILISYDDETEISYDDETEIRHHSSGLGTIQLPAPACCPCSCLLPLPSASCPCLLLSCSFFRR